MIILDYEYAVDRTDAFEFLERTGFPDFIPEGGPSADVSLPIFKNWRFVRSMTNEILFANGIVPGITADEFEQFLDGDL